MHNCVQKNVKNIHVFNCEKKMFKELLYVGHMLPLRKHIFKTNKIIL